MGNNDVFAVLADRTRRAILTVLKDGERSVGDLVAELGVSQPTVSKHLRILREAGMVSMEAQGQRRLYAVEPTALSPVTDWVQEIVGGAARRASASVPDATAARPAPVPVPQDLAGPGPELPGGGAPARRARAAEVLSALSGLRRRGRRPRR